MAEPKEPQEVKEKKELLKYDEVSNLIRKNLTQQGYKEDAISNAEILWGDYAYSFRVEITDSIAWAAAVEYAIAKLEFNEAATKAKIAARYGISEFALSDKYRAICNDLELCLFDERYSTVKNPAQENIRLMREMFGEDAHVRIGLDGRILQ